MNRQFETVLVEYCAPTLAGIKPSNLFSYRPRSDEDIPAAILYWNSQLGARGIQIYLLKHCLQTNTCLLYVCRKKQVEKILSEDTVKCFLEQSGYSGFSDFQAYLQHLSYRLCSQAEFPHEIGIFLGYPLRDVVGFMTHQGKDFICCGQWKVYSDPVTAQKCFYLYRKCAVVYKKLFADGRSIMQLTVAA